MVDAADVSANEGVMIAFLPTTTEWCLQDLPHMTLVYAGSKSDLNPGAFNILAKDAAMIAALMPKFVLSVAGVDVFGDEEKVNVFRFHPKPELSACRRMVEHWNRSQHPFNPHATIGPMHEDIPLRPTYIGFDRVMVGWGDEHLEFNLK